MDKPTRANKEVKKNEMVRKIVLICIIGYRYCRSSSKHHDYCKYPQCTELKKGVFKMKKAVKINSVIGVVEEVGELTFSVRVEDDNYYYMDIIIQVQGDELIAINNGSASASVINNTLGFFTLNIDDSLGGDTRVKLAEKLCSFLHAMI